MATGVNPVFVKTRDIPSAASERPATVLEICLAAERAAGPGSVVGAQTINGLWRIYPATREARSTLLVKGLCVRGTVLQVADMNPFILRNDSGEEKLATKVWIDNVPISVANVEIEHALLKAGCELRSDIKMDRARDPDNKLTRFITGKRFVFVTVPPVPLDKSLKVSIFSAKIYHKEQKLVKKMVICSKCLESNHHASQCTKDIVCRACRKPGHKRGDPACDLPVSSQHVSDKTGKGAARSENGEREVRENVCQREVREKGAKNPKGDSQDRGRSTVRQKDIRSSFQPGGCHRNRSHTPKRPRSSETSSPEVTDSKQARHDGGRTHYSPSDPHREDQEGPQ